MTHRTERGTALLEALIALTVLAVAGIAMLEVAGAALRAQHEVASRERALADADHLLGVYALLTRRELEQRLGQQLVGGYVLRVQRPERQLFRVAVADTLAPETELLVTVVFRPELP